MPTRISRSAEITIVLWMCTMSVGNSLITNRRRRPVAQHRDGLQGDETPSSGDDAHEREERRNGRMISRCVSRTDQRREGDTHHERRPETPQPRWTSA